MSGDGAIEQVPKIAVILAAYNGMAYIEQQLQTILGQADVQVTVFISVDSSDDGTEGCVNRFSLHDSRVKVLPHGEIFGGAARNFYRLIRDVDFSSFDYVSFSDQDDLWLPNKLHKASEVLSGWGFDAYSSNITAFWADGRESIIKKSQPQRRWDFIFESAGPGCTYVFNKRLFDKIKYCVVSEWDSVQNVDMHDWLCYAFARANGYKWFIDPQPLMLYRQHEKNQVGANSGLAALWSRYRQITSGWWLSQSLLIADLIGLSNHTFIKSWSELSRLEIFRLAFQARRCRRSVRDQFLFMIACFILTLTGHRVR